MKKRVIRLKKRNFIYLVAVILIVISLLTSILYFNSDVHKLKSIGYSLKEIKLIDEKKLTLKSKKILLSNNYLNYLSNILNEKNFNEQKLENYIEFYNNFDYKYDSKILNILNEDYYKTKNSKRYFEYYKNNQEYSSREIVENVNCGLDNAYYTLDNMADISKGNLVLVNKYNKLSDNYEPENLVKIEKEYGYERYINKTAYDAFKEMYNAMKKDNLRVFITSPYRSYKYQKSLYNNYVSKNGKEKADSFSARAGYSEHQTGLAIDVSTKDSIYTEFVNTKEYEWMLKNCYKYGFILRYPEGKEYQTGYMFEAWHYRYVGVEVATYIYETGITFDEYYEYFLK